MSLHVMKKPLTKLALSLLLSQASLLQSAVTNPVGLWEFNGNLNATAGGLAIASVGSPSLSYQAYNGGAGNEVLSFPEFSASQWLSVPMTNAAANGGGLYTNLFSLVMDVKFTDTNQWISLWQNNPSNTNDGESFIRPSSSGGGVGISSDYAGTFVSNTWYRIVMTGDLTLAADRLKFYVDGTLVNSVSVSEGVDGRWANYNGTEPGDLKLFADNSGTSETAAGFVGSVAYFDRVLTAADVTLLGASSPAGLSPVVVPEPSRALLGLIGLTLMMIRRRR
jgi:hypothetical protein